MNDPRDCLHVLAYDNARDIVYCTQCMWWWDANFESPPINPDNEPTSEHKQWIRDNGNV